MNATTTADTLRISATAHGANYLPEYFARERGLFADANLDVPYKPCDPWTDVLDDLESGEADIVLGGLWVPAMYAGSSRELVAIGQLNARFPMVVLTREPISDFDWSALSHKTVLVPGAGGTAPYEFTAGVIREAGVELVGTRFVRDLSGGMLSELWRAGLGDAFVADLLTATTLTHSDSGHVALRLAERGGVMPNSVYYVKRERLEELREPLTRFMGAIGSAMATLASGEQTADAVELAASHWPDLPLPVLETVVEDFITNGTWSSSVVDVEACARWIRILSEAGLLLGNVDPADISDPSIAQAAVNAHA
jgi:NitT/TauT family transport system substrate-binding protein